MTGITNGGGGDASVLVLECFHGPTLSFKDVGLQMLAQVLDFLLGRRGAVANVVVETSGDTGPAAIAGVDGLDNVHLFCLFPRGRCSPVQELQMTTAAARGLANVTVYETHGNTDDQAALLQEIFRDAAFRDANNVCAMNSINWVRIAVQAACYVYSYLRVIGATAIATSSPDVWPEVHFAVPTGAFGNAFSGYLAKRMGLPIGRLLVGTNANDIVHRTISAGDFSAGISQATISPAMDIQRPYNFERFLYFLLNEDSAAVRRLYERREAAGAGSGGAGAALDPLLVKRVREVCSSWRVGDAAAVGVMERVWRASGGRYCLDPHSACGVFACQQWRREQQADFIVAHQDRERRRKAMVAASAGRGRGGPGGGTAGSGALLHGGLLDDPRETGAGEVLRSRAAGAGAAGDGLLPGGGGDGGLPGGMGIIPANDLPWVVCIATAHPAKFEAAVVRAVGTAAPCAHPGVAALRALPTRCEVLPTDTVDWKRRWIQRIRADIAAATARKGGKSRL